MPIARHFRWSIIGLIFALLTAIVVADYGVVDAESTESECVLPVASTVPEAALPGALESVIPDTVDGKLVWPDPWDQIDHFERGFR